MSRKILVLGAISGQSKYSPLKRLSKVNDRSMTYTILACTRDSNSTKSKALTGLAGVEVIQCDYDRPGSFFVGPLYGVFLLSVGRKHEVEEVEHFEIFHLHCH